MYSAFEKRLNLSLCHLNDRRPAMRTGERIFRRRKIPQQLIDFRSVKTVVCLYRRFAGSHNDFLGVLLDLGIVGIFLLIYMWISMFKSSKKNDKYSEFALLVIMLIGSLSMELLIKKMFWLVVYLVVVPVVQENRDEKEYYLG